MSLITIYAPKKAVGFLDSIHEQTYDRPPECLVLATYINL
jgi:hypothetical protein